MCLMCPFLQKTWSGWLRAHSCEVGGTALGRHVRHARHGCWHTPAAWQANGRATCLPSCVDLRGPANAQRLSLRHMFSLHTQLANTAQLQHCTPLHPAAPRGTPEQHPLLRTRPRSCCRLSLTSVRISLSMWSVTHCMGGQCTGRHKVVRQRIA